MGSSGVCLCQRGVGCQIRLPIVCVFDRSVDFKFEFGFWFQTQPTDSDESISYERKMKMNKIQALAKYLHVDPASIRTVYWDDQTFNVDGDEYLVLTDDEADARLRADIRESVWAFNLDFIAEHSSVCSANRKAFAELVKIAQEKLCESANDLFLSLIDDFDEFAADAKAIDGRGHFLATYDGNEIELGDGLCAYRVG